MARQDTFGPKLLEAFQTTERPLTLPEAAQIAGSSIKRAYAWADRNRGILVASATKGPNGGVTYMTRDNPHRARQPENAGGKHTHVEGESERLGIGTLFHVVAMGLRGGKIELELMTAGGETIRVVMIEANGAPAGELGSAG